MTNDDFISIVRLPESVKVEYDSDLKELVDRYPYFVQSRLLYLKALQKSNSIHFAANLKIASIYCNNRRWLYYYLYPEKKLSVEPYERNKNGKSSGDYFDMIQILESEGGDTKQSLKNLAEKLKTARSIIFHPIVQSDIKLKINTVLDNKEKEKVTSDSTSNVLQIESTNEISEINAKKLILEHKYAEAIEILRTLNLNNPKKSVYFADQVRFLEKVIANSKK